jgi:rubrerythrin
MYKAAKISAEAGKDTDVGKMHVCSVCGWTGEGDAPDNCPLCSAKKELIKIFS